MSNHLGNVLAVVSDRKLARVRFPGSDEVKFYDADVTSHSEYYPFGMTSRSGSDGGNYRYGFQGQEMDDEVKGEGNSVNYKYRMHDPRIGRFFAVDPLTPKYPHYTPYSFSGNKVIQFVELEGLEESKFETTLYRPRTDLMSKEQLERQRELANMIVSPVRAAYNIGATIVTGVGNMPSYINREFSGEYGYDTHFVPIYWQVKPDGENTYEHVEGEQRQMEVTAEASTEIAIEIAGGKLVDGIVTGGKILLKKLDNVPTTTINPKSVEPGQLDDFIDNGLSGKETFQIKGGGKYNYGKFEGRGLQSSIEEIRSDLNIPEDWLIKVSKNDPGIKFVDPNNTANNHVRVSPGINGASYESTRTMNVKWYKNGSPMDVNGDVIPNPSGKEQNRTSTGHIPYENFKYVP